MFGWEENERKGECRVVFSFLFFSFLSCGSSSSSRGFSGWESVGKRGSFFFFFFFGRFEVRVKSGVWSERKFESQAGNVRWETEKWWVLPEQFMDRTDYNCGRDCLSLRQLFCIISNNYIIGTWTVFNHQSS